MSEPDGQEQRTTFYREAYAELIDPPDAGVGCCDACGKMRPIFYRGLCMGMETFACEDCAP